MLPETNEDLQPGSRFKFNSLTSRFADFVESKKTSLLIFFSLLYVSVAIYLTTQKLFWNDELYTLYFARLPAWPDLWRALSTGADQIPPTFVLLTKLSISILGVNAVSLRIPEITAFLLMCLCLYRIVSIRTSPLYGFMAMLFPAITTALHYAYEARGYALVLAAGALAFYCWQSVGRGYMRRLHLIGLCVALSGALMSHYYAILLFFPLLVGELARTRTLTKIDLPVWIIFVVSLYPLLIFLPLIQASATYGQHFWSVAQWSDAFLFYDYLLRPAAVLSLFIFIFVYVTSNRGAHGNNINKSLPIHEIAASVAFILIPAFAIAGAKLTIAAYTNRHALLSVLGFGILFPSLMFHYTKRNSTMLILAFLLTGFFGKAVSELRICNEDSEAYTRNVSFIQSNSSPGIPVVSWFSGTVVQLWYYAPEELASRVYYLADPEASLRYLGHNTIERGLIDLKPWFPIKNVQPYRSFVKSQRRFFLYYCSGQEDWVWNWIVSSLLNDHMHIELKARQGDQYLFLITAP